MRATQLFAGHQKVLAGQRGLLHMVKRILNKQYIKMMVSKMKPGPIVQYRYF